SAAFAFDFGRLAPRWGRGLLLGSPAEPWSIAASDRGRRAGFRGRSGEGAWLRAGGPLEPEALYGRFARRDLAAVAVRLFGLKLATVSDIRGGSQAGVSLERGGAGSEVAVDRAGAWRA